MNEGIIMAEHWIEEEDELAEMDDIHDSITVSVANIQHETLDNKHLSGEYLLGEHLLNEQDASSSFIIQDILSPPSEDGITVNIIITFSSPVDRSTLSGNDFVLTYYTAENQVGVQGQIDSLLWIDANQLQVTLLNQETSHDYRIGVHDHAEIRDVSGSLLSLDSIDKDPVEAYTLLFDSASSTPLYTETPKLAVDYVALDEKNTLETTNDALATKQDTDILWRDVSLDGEGVLQLNGNTDADFVKRLADSRLSHSNEDASWHIEITQASGETGYAWSVGQEQNGYTSIVYSNGVSSYTLEIDTGASDAALTLTIV